MTRARYCVSQKIGENPEQHEEEERGGRQRTATSPGEDQLRGADRLLLQLDRGEIEPRVEGREQHAARRSAAS